MWIRSQDKETLIKSEIFDITDYENENVFVIWGRNNIWLGQYSTKEKALKVLDMIQEHIKNMYIGTGDYMGKPFQMPQDEEVKL